jgi:hypothetical protein
MRGAATGRWRRYGAFSGTEVPGDVIFENAEVNKRILHGELDNRRLMQAGGCFVYCSSRCQKN